MGDLATKHDVAHEGQLLRAEMAVLRAELGSKIDAQGKELSDAMRRLTVTLFGTTVALWLGTMGALVAF